MIFWGPQVECYDLKTHVWLTHWHAIDLWWSVSTLIFVGFRVHLGEEPPGVSLRASPESTRKDNPPWMWVAPFYGRGPRLNQKRSISDPLALISLCSPMDVPCDPLPSDSAAIMDDCTLSLRAKVNAPSRCYLSPGILSRQWEKQPACQMGELTLYQGQTPVIGSRYIMQREAEVLASRSFSSRRQCHYFLSCQISASYHSNPRF